MARKKTVRKEAQLSFEALSIEGALLSPEWLSRVAQLGADHQSEPAYRIPKGLNLRDEIGRYWRIAQAHWSDLSVGRASGGDPVALAERFVLALLRDSFGFASIRIVPPITLADRLYPVGHMALGTRVPIVIAPAGSGLDGLAPAFGDGARRRSAFGLVQEYLNADEGALWGIVSDGLSLRIARDNASLTRPAWVEADVARMFTEERFADFAALWLLAHETRFGEADQSATECPLETWREAGREQGTRARGQLRDGVESALLALGQGFLAHPANQKLRGDLQSGALTTKDYFNQLLRLVYRVIFLLTVEERGLLHPEGTDEKARTLYEAGYSLRRLRERAVKRSAHDRFADLWDTTKIVFSGLAIGESRLGLPPLAGIYATSQCPDLDAAKLENRALLAAMFRLSWIRDDGSLSRVNWRDMGPEELGSVYESLLELVPQITKDGRQFAFATGGETKGNARKTSGSYYTPDSLVQVLLDSALEPVVSETIARHPSAPVEALLSLSVVDPACGSGHFLLAAARRLAAHVARLQANGTPSASEYRHALRQVVGRCIYGVDLNPMAVELCKVSLWMEAVDPGLPLTFLNSHIQRGNALLGATPELMANGIPDEAWKPLDGDDKQVAIALKRRNKNAAKVEYGLALFGVDSSAEHQAVTRAMTALDGAPDADVAALAQKESQWGRILGSSEYRHQKLVADAWCAAFVWPKQPGPQSEAAPTMDVWRNLRDGHASQLAQTESTTTRLAQEYSFFHWHLQFPQVFDRGGFDVVLGNPPWERVKLQEQEFFASRSAEIANAPNAAARKKLIAGLDALSPALWREWKEASRAAAGTKEFLRESARFPLTGQGDVNTYALFAELDRTLLSASGRAGFVVPTGVATDDSTKDFFAALVRQNEIARFLSFENEDRIFPSVHHAFKFALVTLDRSGRSRECDFVFFARSIKDLQDAERHFSLTAEDLTLINPHTLTAPTFRSKRDAELTKSVHRRVPTLKPREDGPSGWSIVLRRMMHMSDDAPLFRTAEDLGASGWVPRGATFWRAGATMLPLFEAKLVHLFDHRFATYAGQTEAQANQGKCPELTDLDHSDPRHQSKPRYWVPETEVSGRLGSEWTKEWILGWRDICRSVDQRTLITALVPRVAVAGFHQIRIYAEGSECASLYANLCSFAVDYIARQKVGGTHLTYGILEQLPVIEAARFALPAPWCSSEQMGAWLHSRVLELAYTAWDLEPFAQDVGYRGPPFRWDPARRFLLRCELDAAFFHLYGLSRDDTDYVMETFPIVRRHDERAHGEYRTKRVILEIYDAMADASRSGDSYQTRLMPSPADPAVAHPESSRPRADNVQ